MFGATKESLIDEIRLLNDHVRSMPPWCGNNAEAELLAEYLVTLQPGYIDLEDVPPEPPTSPMQDDFSF